MLDRLLSLFRKKQPVRPVRYPEPPCGDYDTHYHWVYDIGWSCPRCAGIEAQTKKLADEDRLAKKIAEHVVRLQREAGSK